MTSAPRRLNYHDSGFHGSGAAMADWVLGT